MPSVALRLRADGDGDGYADIWRNEIDGLGLDRPISARRRMEAERRLGNSRAHPGQPQSGGDRLLRVTAPRCPQVYRRLSRWLTHARVASARVWRPIGRSLPDNEMATFDRALRLRLPPAYLLTTNYRSILDYNCSNFYAISVGVLVDAIARR